MLVGLPCPLCQRPQRYRRLAALPPAAPRRFLSLTPGRGARHACAASGLLSGGRFCCTPLQGRLKWLHEEVGLRKSEVTAVLRKYASVGKLGRKKAGQAADPCWRLGVAQQGPGWRRMCPAPECNSVQGCGGPSLRVCLRTEPAPPSPLAHPAAVGSSPLLLQQWRDWLVDQGVSPSQLPQVVTRLPHVLTYR